ncbi:MAG: radical SAM protein [Bacteroidales bacterium]|nr:radical SAM protein [Bacteroidales bacterium]
MLDHYNRHITYLRISVTDRCNLRCQYCMPEEGIKSLPHNEILTFDEIVDVVKEAVSLGVNKVRLTGGEPLVRKGVVELVRMIAQIKGITDFGMTSNGILLKQFAQQLKDAGLQRINISLDTLNPHKFRELTRGGELAQVLEGIDAAKAAGLHPIKLNCVIKKSSQEPDAQQVNAFAEQNGLQVRFIHQMDLEKGEFSVVEGGEGGNCAICNRLRLTANGYINPCLFNEAGFSVRQLGVRQAILAAVDAKPKCGSHNHSGEFYNIGG